MGGRSLGGLHEAGEPESGVIGHYFVSYSAVDGADFAVRLADRLVAGPPSIPAWLDRRELRPGEDWDDQVVEAIRSCVGILFVMTPDSVHPKSVCKQEWSRALTYRKPVIPLRLSRDAELPFRLGSRQFVDFTGSFDAGLAQLRDHLNWRATPAGELRALEERLEDAERELPRTADPARRTHVEQDIRLLRRQIDEQRRLVADPLAASRRADARIASGLERERQPDERQGRGRDGARRTRFVNPPPLLAPNSFQDRQAETAQIAYFLRDDGLRLMTVVGRGGIGKTALVCRLLRALEGGQLPDDLGPLPVDGIVYLSQVGTQAVAIGFPNLLRDLCQLLPDDDAGRLHQRYRDPSQRPATLMLAVLEALPPGRVVVLLDNFEDVVDPETGAVGDGPFDEALRALLTGPHHPVKMIVTTRVAPRELLFVQPGRQHRLDLDQGLPAPYAENLLRAMDADGSRGLRTASDYLLGLARERTRGYPRALEALAAILAADRGTALPELLDQAADLLPEEITEALVGEAFDRLDPLAKQVMQALAVYSAPVPPVAVDYLLQPFLPAIDSAPVLSRLVAMHFASREAGRYHLHPVDRDYALGRIPEGSSADRTARNQPFTRYALRHRGGDYFKQTRAPRASWKTLDDLAPQLAEFELRCHGEDYDNAAAVLGDIDFDYLLLWGHTRLLARLHEQLQNKLTDPKASHNNINILGVCYSELGQVDRAIEYHRQALEIARSDGNRWGEGNSLGNLGGCYLSVGETSLAVEGYQQALDIARRIGNHRSEAAALIGLGICRQISGQIDRAIEYYLQAFDIARQAGERQDEITPLNGLGQCSQIAGRIGRAIDYHRRALEISREAGDRRSEQTSLGGLGLCYSDMGQTSRAVEHLGQELDIAREIGNRLSEGSSLGDLGLCYSDMGQTSRAVEYLGQALDIAREIGNRHGEGAALGNLGIVRVGLGETARGIQDIRAALNIAREVGARMNEAICLSGLAAALADLGDWDESVQHYELAVSIADETGYRQVQAEGRCGLGQVRLLCGEWAAARRMAEDAIAHDHPRNTADAYVVLGLALLRADEAAPAQDALNAAMAAADARLETDDNYGALDAKGLALSGLALLTRPRVARDAADAFRRARALNRDRGIVAHVLRLFDVVAAADPGGTLTSVRGIITGHDLAD